VEPVSPAFLGSRLSGFLLPLKNTLLKQHIEITNFTQWRQSGGSRFTGTKKPAFAGLILSFTYSKVTQSNT